MRESSNHKESKWSAYPPNIDFLIWLDEMIIQEPLSGL